MTQKYVEEDEMKQKTVESKTYIFRAFPSLPDSFLFRSTSRGWHLMGEIELEKTQFKKIEFNGRVFWGKSAYLKHVD